MISNNTPADANESITFTATVISNVTGTDTPDGTVQFVINGSNIGDPVTLNSSGQAQLTIDSNSLTSTDNEVVVEYSGSTSFAASDNSASPFNQELNQIPTTTSLSSSLNSSVYGDNVTFTAVVSANGSTPNGQVQFKLNGSNYGSLKL